MSGEDPITRLLSADATIAWSTLRADGRATVRVRSLASSTIRTIVDGPAEVFSLILAPPHTYVGYKFTTYRIDNTSSAQTIVATTSAMRSLAVSNTTLYHGDIKGDLFRRQLDAPATTPSDLVYDSEPEFHDVVLDLGDIYWSSGDRIMRLVR